MGNLNTILKTRNFNKKIDAYIKHGDLVGFCDLLKKNNLNITNIGGFRGYYDTINTTIKYKQYGIFIYLMKYHYNTDPDFKRVINLILSQSYPNMILIEHIIDGCSNMQLQYILHRAVEKNRINVAKYICSLRRINEIYGNNVLKILLRKDGTYNFGKGEEMTNFVLSLYDE